jgi:hypothetical protein
MDYKGQCHCGKVSFRFQAELSEVVKCDCSLCQKRNALMVTVEKAKFEISQGQEELTLYKWNSGVALHYFCGLCGIYVYHQRRTNPELLSVNASCIDNLDLGALPVRQVDGKIRSAAALVKI